MAHDFLIGHPVAVGCGDETGPHFVRTFRADLLENFGISD
jgi:hypothetical protein